jgi:hypothetical protein
MVSGGAGSLGVCLRFGEVDQSLLDLLDPIGELGEIDALTQALEVFSLGRQQDPGGDEPVGSCCRCVVGAHGLAGLATFPSP